MAQKSCLANHFLDLIRIIPNGSMYFLDVPRGIGKTRAIASLTNRDDVFIGVLANSRQIKLLLNSEGARKDRLFSNPDTMRDMKFNAIIVFDAIIIEEIFQRDDLEYLINTFKEFQCPILATGTSLSLDKIFQNLHTDVLRKGF